MCQLHESLVNDIEYAGVHPAVALRLVRQSVGSESLRHWYVHSETTLDGAQVFRHVTVALLTVSRLIRVHVDEDAGRALASFTR